MKRVFKISILAVFFILIAIFTNSVKANSINSINMDIYVDSNGDAEVTETWNCYTSHGTEGYHPYYHLGRSKITNLRVSDKTQNYTTMSSWDTSNSFSSKAYKCGINKITDGVELCWGISKYGSNTYTVKYNISNFISELSDAQMAYWTLIPYDFSESIGDVKIKIYSDKYFQDTIDVWGYGNYGGLCYVNNGAIYMDSDGSLGTSEYMTILAKFPLGTFDASNLLDYNFNHFYQMAQDGSTAYNKKQKSTSFNRTGAISAIVYIVFQFSPIVIAGIAGVYATNGKKFGFKYGKLGKKIPKNTAYYRDIPCDGDIFRTYYIAYQYNLIKNKTDILGAIILKWLKEGIIKTEQRQGGKIFKRENTVIILGEESEKSFTNIRESKLFHMMYVASKDGILENKEFEKWCGESYSTILNWFDNILLEQREKLVKEGLIIFEKGGFWGKKYRATPDIKNEAMAIAGLKRFLLDYSLISQREAIEVELFEDYLVFAQMLGIAKQVSKQFKELYPDIIEQTNYGSYDNIIYINYCASSGIKSANFAREAAGSYSGGGGGFSSGGGGGGSFGGGGGRRRFPLELIGDRHTLVWDDQL